MKEFIEKLIERLEDEKAKEMIFGFKNIDNPFKKGCIDNRVFAYDKAIKIVNELAEEYSENTSQNLEDGWIPCSERLPSVGVSALCYWKKYNKYDNTTSYYYSLMHRNEDNQWLGDLGMCNGEVLAWMPLPPVYKKGSE